MELPRRLTFILQGERERHWSAQNAPLEVMEEWRLSMLVPTPTPQRNHGIDKEGGNSRRH